MFTRLENSKQLTFALDFFAGGFEEMPVILCVGSDRVTGDSFGPLTGEALKRKFDAPAFVYGSLSRPVTALNIETTVRFIRARHPGNPILAIDSALGEESEKGRFRVFSGPLKPGAADGKRLPPVGDVSLTVTVAVPKEGLFGVKLALVSPLAQIAAAGIYDFVNGFVRRLKTAH